MSTAKKEPNRGVHLGRQRRAFRPWWMELGVRLAAPHGDNWGKHLLEVRGGRGGMITLRGSETDRERVEGLQGAFC